MDKSRYDINANHVVALRNIMGLNKGIDTIIRSASFVIESDCVNVMIKDGYLFIFFNILNNKNSNVINSFKISIDMIECYGIEGEKYYGQRMVLNGVKSVTFDSRVTYINYFDNGVRKKMTFLIDLYQYLLDTIPEKSDDIVYSIKKMKIINGVVNNKRDKLKEIDEMCCDGIISYDDYKIAKRDILVK